jgi:hypothetical protein
VEEATHEDPSIRNGRKRTTKADRLRLDDAHNVEPLLHSADRDNILIDLLDTWLS